MAEGIINSGAEILVFIDADLVGFKVKHALKLANPILTGETDMVLGQPTATLIKPWLNPFKMFSGQRAAKKEDILPILEKIKGAGYGVETIINMHFKGNNKKVAYVNLDGLCHPTKFEKANLAIAILGFIKEGAQIARAFILNLELILKPGLNRFVAAVNLKP